MAFVVPQVGAKALLNLLMNSYINNMSTCSLGLYTSPTTQLANTASAIGGATAISAPTSIYAAASSAGGTAYCPAAAFTFTQTAIGTQTVWGWYIQSGDGIIMSELFSSPITLEANGDQVRVSSHTFRMHGP